MAPDSSRPLQAQDIDHHVADRLRRRRVELGLTQQQLAGAVGLSYQQIQKYETAVNRIGAGRLFCIALALEVRTSYFFAGLSEGQLLEDRAIDALRGGGSPPLKPAVRAALLNLLDSLE
jgi:transcriptional regulator with XRE-family HTH domain